MLDTNRPAAATANPTDPSGVTVMTTLASIIARELGVTDRGAERPSYRDMLGSPHPKNPAAVY